MGSTVPTAVAAGVVPELRRQNFHQRLVRPVVGGRETGAVLAKVHQADRAIVIGKESQGGGGDPVDCYHVFDLSVGCAGGSRGPGRTSKLAEQTAAHDSLMVKRVIR